MEIFLVALSSLRANKLRSILTIVGIIVGIFSIIAISTIVSILQNSIEESASQLSQTTFQIQKFPAMMQHGDRAKYRNRKDISIEEYFELKDKMTNDAKAVGAEQWGFGKVFSFRNKETNPNLSFVGCTPEAFPNNQWIPENGRIFTANDVQRYEKVIVLGSSLANTLTQPYRFKLVAAVLTLAPLLTIADT